MALCTFLIKSSSSSLLPLDDFYDQRYLSFLGIARRVGGASFSLPLSPFFCIFIPQSLIVSLQKRSRASTLLTVVYQEISARSHLFIYSKLYQIFISLVRNVSNQILEPYSSRMPLNFNNFAARDGSPESRRLRK